MNKFPTGRLLMTRGVADKIADDPTFAGFVLESIHRHGNGDWGDLGEEDKAENDFSLRNDLRLFSAYEQDGLPRIWIITEADRSSTTILLPCEY